jgi:long-chain acyl-CoA synthetase
MEITRLFDFLQHQLSNYPQNKAFSYRHEGKDISYSTTHFADLVNKVSRGLLKMGLQKGDTVGLVSVKNRPEWCVMDAAMQQIGVVSVPVYPTISPREYEYIFNDAQIKYCFIGEKEVYLKVKNAQANVASLKELYTFDAIEGAMSWETIFDETLALSNLEIIKSSIKTEDLVTIIYTSGTTGEPKGVMLSHENIVSNVLAIRPNLPIKDGDSALSFLPLCHIFERVCYHAYIYVGAQVTFAGTDNLGGDEGDLKRVKPMFFTTVPRLLEKIYEKLYNKGLTLTGAKRSIFFWALKLTDDFEYDKKYTGLRAIQHKIADKLIYSKWREALGGNVCGIVTGASACPVKILRTFSCAGIPVREGYGLTEASPGIAISLFEKGGAMLGAIGPAVPGVEIYIDSSDGDYREGEGEVLSRGQNTMMGYYKKQDKTDEVIAYIDGKKYLRTGDVGKLIKGANGMQFLKITDRKKELMKTSGGKYVAPAPIESRLKESYLIEQVMIVGENQKFVSALIVPAEEALCDWCSKNDVAWTNLQEAVKTDKVQAKFQEVIERYNPEFSHVEQIKKFVLLNSTWEAVKADGSAAELTPTMKLKRRVILEKFNDKIQEIYEG